MNDLELKGGITRQVRGRISHRLESCSISAIDVARDLSLSLRTLQRRLTEEGTSFTNLLDEVRRDIALDAGTSAKPSLEVLARNLGYRQQSTLTRAFRRWVGTSPSEFYHLYR